MATIGENTVTDSKRFHDPNRGPLTLEHNEMPQDPKGDYTPSAGDPIRQAKLHNHHKTGYEKPSSSPPKAVLGLSAESDTKQIFGRKTQFVMSGVTNSSGSGGGMFMYGSDPGGKPVEYSSAITLQEKTSADLLKRRKQQEEAEHDIARWRQRKADEMQLRQEEKRKDLEMLKGYVPWGKPGAGAPMFQNTSGGLVHARKGKLLEDNCETEPYAAEFEGIVSVFGKPGAGAPNRTPSGHLQTGLKQELNTRFQSTMKRDIESHFRYVRGSHDVADYANSLDAQLKQQIEQQAREKEWEIQKETEMMQYDPYGRPGAGAPNRNEKGYVVAAIKNSLNSESSKSIEEKMRYGQKLERQIQEKAIARQQPVGETVDYDPWGKGLGAPQRDQSGNIRRYKHSDHAHIREFSPILESDRGLAFGRPGAGAPILNDRGKPRPHLQQTLKEDVALDVTSNQDSRDYFQFGRPGGGAPVKTQDGKLVAKRARTTHELEQVRNSQQKEYLDLLRYDMEAKRDRDRQQREEDLRQSTEFAHLVEQGKIGQPRRDPATGQVLKRQPRTGSDVTSVKLDIRRPDPAECMDYHKALSEQIENHRRQKNGSVHTGLNGRDEDVQLPWQRAVGKDRLQQQMYGQELGALMSEKGNVKMHESSERLAEEQQHVESYNGLWGRPGAGAPRRDAQGNVNTQRNYKTLQEESYRTDPVRL